MHVFTKGPALRRQTRSTRLPDDLIWPCGADIPLIIQDGDGGSGRRASSGPSTGGRAGAAGCEEG